MIFVNFRVTRLDVQSEFIVCWSRGPLESAYD